MKPIVITPYKQESLKTLKRCHNSVLSQTIETTHILVADGRGKAVVDQWDAQHLILPRCHNNCGNTPRGLGALMAASQGYEPIFFLDADNWFKPNHVELALAVHQNDPSIDVVSPSAQFYWMMEQLDGAPEDVDQYFADTSTLAYLRGLTEAFRSGR